MALVLAVFFALTSNSLGEELAPPPDDAQDLLFLGPLRPVWLRLHVTIDGKPFRQIWRSNIERLFAEADVNGDGVVLAAATNTPPPETIEALASAAAVYLGQDVAQAKTGLAQAADAAGGRLTRQAFEDYFQRVAPPFTVAVGLGRTTAGQALFPLLDEDGDRQLTAAELIDAEAKLRIRDFNDDESLTQGELADAPNASLAAAVQTAAEKQSGRLPASGPVTLLPAGAKGEDVSDVILSRYDRNGDGQLNTAGEPTELLPTAVQARRLQLAAAETIGGEALRSFCQGSPDLELTIELGKVQSSGSRTSPFRRSRPKKADDSARRPAASIDDSSRKKLPDGSWQVSLDDASLTLRRNNRDPSKNNDQGPRLQNYDADGNGYLDEKELAGAAGLAADFATIDADGNGKIFAAELEAFTERQLRAAAARLLLEVSDLGQELFHHLDANHDYRLSTRELHNAAEILAQIDANHDRRLSADEIPQQLLLELSRNTAAGAQAERRAINREKRVRTATKKGPGWFQKMDRNDDGEVSPREFLGPPAAFEKLDADKNGVIDDSEAAGA